MSLGPLHNKPSEILSASLSSSSTSQQRTYTLGRLGLRSPSCSTMDSPWEDDPNSVVHRDIEWTKISSEFTNVGYREGITAGKEAALQEGFDAGFANVGVPIGRELGILRGFSSALLGYISTISQTQFTGLEVDVQAALSTAREIAANLSEVRFTDIAPRDIEAEEHAREHLEAEGMEMEENEELQEKRKMEGIEDLLSAMTASDPTSQRQRPTMEDVRVMKQRMQALAHTLGLDLLPDIS